MSYSKMRDVGAKLKGFNAVNAATVTAGTGADGTEVNGFIYDRLTPGGTNKSLYQSAKVIIQYDGNLGADGNSLTIASNLQHSDSTASTSFADFADIDGSTGVSVTQTRATGGGNSTPSGVLEYDVDLSQAKRYVRVQLTPTLSASATDTVDYGCVMVLGGADVDPAA